MEGYDVVTSDDCKYGRVVGVQDGHVIVEHGTLRKSRHAIPETFATADDSERVVHLTVSKEIIDGSPKLEGGSLERQAIAEHYGLAESMEAPATEGYGDTLPDDPARSADEEAIAAGRQPADQQRAEIREGGLESGGEEELGSSPALLGDRVRGTR
jgi:hypothetical protein